MKIDNLEFANVWTWDAPDFCDAYIVNCDIDGKQATDEQLDALNDDSALVYDLLQDYLY